MNKLLRWMPLIGFVPLYVVASAQTPVAQIQQLAQTTSLDREGLKPWHIRMNFNLYDLSGKKPEAGMIEEWWASPQSYRISVTSPSLKGSLSDDVPESLLRETYLVRLLLEQVVAPVPNLPDWNSVGAERRNLTLGNVPLVCFSLKSTNPEVKVSGPEYCTEPGKDILRLSLDSNDGMSTVRNRLGRFQGISVALENSIGFSGKTSISGSVETMETFDPASLSEPLHSHPEAKVNALGLVVAGRRIRFYQPDYPIVAKAAHVSGTVVLNGIISKQGTIRALAVVASPDASLSTSALNAVKLWTYAPYLFDGKPTEVNTTITVHYNLGGG